jgi:hypothetical protein
MNTYEIKGNKYNASNEYNAVRQAYRMANNIALEKYLGGEKWNYIANFTNGKAKVIVSRIR